MHRRYFSLPMIALLLMLSAALSACGDGSGTPTPIAPAGNPTSIVFVTTGTIAGIKDTLRIETGRAAKFTGRTNSKSGTLPEDVYNDVVAQIKAADFFNLQEKYDTGTVSDDRYYTITVQQGTVTKTVMVAEIGGKDQTPQALLDLIEKLAKAQTSIQ